MLLAVAIAGCNKDDDDNNGQVLNDTDRTFMTSASYGNNAEIDAGTTASSMASITAVQSFGTRMVTDHTAAQGDLVLVGTQVGVSNLPTTPDSAHIQLKAMLVTLSGRAFDSAYMKLQQTDHANTIALFQNEINNGSNTQVKNYATTHLPTIQMHKQMADSIVAAYGW
jgi:putative membrane protein